MPAWKPCVLAPVQWPPPDWGEGVVGGGGGWVGHQMNKFEQISGDHDQMSLAGGLGSPDVQGEREKWGRFVVQAGLPYLIFPGRGFPTL